MKKFKKVLYVLCGFSALGLGIIGIVLPILPTTPFLLLASACFFKSSERLDNWFKGTKIYNKHLKTFVENKAMTLRQKWSLMLFADFMMMFPFIILDSLAVKLLIIAVVLLKFYYFMFRIETIKK